MECTGESFFSPSRHVDNDYGSFEVWPVWPNLISRRLWKLTKLRMKISLACRTFVNEPDSYGEHCNIRTQGSDFSSAVRRSGRIVQRIFCSVQSKARTSAVVWKWSVETEFSGAIFPPLKNFSCRQFLPELLRPAPTICPWVPLMSLFRKIHWTITTKPLEYNMYVEFHVSVRVIAVETCVKQWYVKACYSIHSKTWYGLVFFVWNWVWFLRKPQDYV